MIDNPLSTNFLFRDVIDRLVQDKKNASERVSVTLMNGDKYMLQGTVTVGQDYVETSFDGTTHVLSIGSVVAVTVAPGQGGS